MLADIQADSGACYQPIDEVDSINRTICALDNIDGLVLGTGDSKPGGGLDRGEDRQRLGQQRQHFLFL